MAGGLATAIFAWVFYFPPFRLTWRDLPHYLLSQYVEVIVFCLAGILSHAAGSGGISLRKETAPDVPPIECDPEQLRQVLLNLTINAIQAMPEGGEIVISARLEEDKVVLQVRDQGHGVDPDNMDRIFDPFFTTKETGTGLGLSVAHQIAEQLRGVLTAEHNLDRGMTFSLALPVDRGQSL